MAGKGELVLHLAGYAAFGGDIFRGYAHMVIHERIDKAVVIIESSSRALPILAPERCFSIL